MPCKSKSAISHIKNLGSNEKKQPAVTIEDVDDEDEPFNQTPSYSSDLITQRASEDGFSEAEDELITMIGYLDNLEEEPLPDLMSQSSDQEDLGLDLDSEDEFEEIDEISPLEKFANTLAEVQRVAVEAEDKQLKEYNCPKHYLGNSARNKRWQRQIGRELEAKGYHSIKEWFSKMKKTSDKVQDSDASDHEGSDERSLGSGLDNQVDDPDSHSCDLVWNKAFD